MRVRALHHVQLAMPTGGEADAIAFYADDPFGNRIELMEPAPPR